MLETTRSMIANQLEAVLCVLKACIDRCPEDAWDFKIGRYGFGQVVFHTLFFADYYVGADAGEMRAQPFHRENAEFFGDYEELEDRPPRDLHDRPSIERYFEHCRKRARAAIAAETAESLAAPFAFERFDCTRAEAYLHLVRHIQHHAAQLSLRLRVEKGVDVPWIKSGCATPRRAGAIRAERAVALDINEYNSRAWDREVERGNRWTVPVTPEEVANARTGRFEIVLTPTRPVPMDWFGNLDGADVLCLAGAGGQQAPILAAVGARVTVLDNSERQLEQDRRVAVRESLELKLVRGDMTDLSAFDEATFDLVFHPCSNCFVPDIRPVWNECHRVLRPGGVLLSGFANPAQYIFDQRKAEEEGVLEVRHSLPYAEPDDLGPSELEHYVTREEPLLFGHTLEDQLGGQVEAGLAIVGFFEDAEPGSAIAKHMPIYIATRAIKPTSTPT